MRGEAEQNCFEIVKINLNKDVYFAMSYKDDCVIKKAFQKLYQIQGRVNSLILYLMVD